MNLVQTIEEIDPGHFARREDILEDLRTKARELGFFPVPLSWHDVECFWITLEPNDSHKGKKIRVTRDDLKWDAYVDVLKEVAKHEKR